MKKIFIIPLACCLLMNGCASSSQVKEIETSSKRHEKMLYETDQRLDTLKQKVDEINQRSYEILTNSGKKSNMKVVPVAVSQKSEIKLKDVQPENQATQENSDPELRRAVNTTAQTAPILTPSIPPLQLPDGNSQTSVPPNNSHTKVATSEKVAKNNTVTASKQQRVVGPSGSLGTVPAESDIALPPAALPLPVTDQPSNTKSLNTMPPPASMQANANKISVPPMPPADLALPPEHPLLSPPVQASQITMPPESSTISSKSTAAVSDKKNGAQAQNIAKLSSHSGQEETAYKTALGFAMSGRSAEGITQFRKFLQEYPGGRYAANAEYWIGECFYAQRNYKEALAQFQLVNTHYASHHKNADALLKAGITLNKLGDKQGATEKFRTLQTAFPGSDAAKRANEMGIIH